MALALEGVDDLTLCSGLTRAYTETPTTPSIVHRHLRELPVGDDLLHGRMGPAMPSSRAMLSAVSGRR